MRFKAFAKVCVRVTLNRAITINIRVREKLKKKTVQDALFEGGIFLFTLHMVFAAPGLSEIYLFQSETLDGRPKTDATDRRENNSARN